MNSYINYKQNLHTHTTFCDGKNTPEEMVLKAIGLGFDTIGFSGHSYTGFDINWHMTPENTGIYKKEISLLKEKYKNQINVLCGLEFEMLSSCDTDGYDYVIGSSHFMKKDNEIIEFDVKAHIVEDIINRYFDGDGMKYAKAYYEHIVHLPEYGNFDIVGHFDIISKHCETHNFFDTESEEYKNYALEALHTLTEKIKVFEVNTGAIARGYRTCPYPAPFILKSMKELGCTVVLTSDCHNKNHLDCHYKEAVEYIASCGFNSIGIFRNGVIEEVKISVS